MNDTDSYTFGGSLRSISAAIRNPFENDSFSEGTWKLTMTELKAKRIGTTARLRLLMDAITPATTPSASPKTRNRGAAKRARAARKITLSAHA